MLTKSSVLHYWSSRYGINPRVGGRPVFTRNSAGLFTTQEGELDSAIINTPRFDWATLNLPNGQTERRKVLTLELARTNVNATALGSWTSDGATITTGQADPAGGTNAGKVNHTGGNGRIYVGVSWTADGTKAIALGIQYGNGAGSTFRLYDVTAGVTRQQVQVTWTNGVPAAATTVGGGTILPIQPLVGGWYLLQFAPNSVVAANSNRVEILPGTSNFFNIYRPTFENGAFSTSLLDPSVSRAADSLYWNFPPVPQAMMIFLRFVERGTIASGNGTGLFYLGNAAGTEPRFLFYNSSGFYRAYHHNGVSAVAATLGTAPVYGDTVDLAGIFQSDGKVDIYQSINGAAVTSAGLSAGLSPLASAFSGQAMQVNNNGPSAVGAAQFADIKIVKFADVVASTAQGIMDELRAFELGPNGDVL